MVGRLKVGALNYPILHCKLPQIILGNGQYINHINVEEFGRKKLFSVDVYCMILVKERLQRTLL